MVYNKHYEYYNKNYSHLFPFLERCVYVGIFSY